jgi:hypothetical protein
MRIDGPNIYLRYLEEEEVEGLQEAIRGFWPDGTMPTKRELYKFRYGVGVANNSMFDRTELTDSTDLHEAVYAIVLQDNSVVGYNVTMYEERKFVSVMTALLPDYRNYGYYREVVYLRHRLGFDVLKATQSNMKMPLDGESAIKTVLDALYDETLDTFKFQNAIWRWGCLSEAHYRAYLEANPEINSIPWEIDW